MNLGNNDESNIEILIDNTSFTLDDIIINLKIISKIK